MKEPVSFFSEHTAEYILMPQFAKMLGQHYENIVPMYFWTSREGGVFSRESMSGKLIKVVALYPRRPKIFSIDGDEIHVTFNEILFARAKEYIELGIGVFAGVPLVSNLSSLNFGVRCSWFNLRPWGCEQIALISLKGSIAKLNKGLDVVDALNLKSIIDRDCIEMDWCTAVNIIKTIKGGYFGGLFGDLYKPAYLIFSE